MSGPDFMVTAGACLLIVLIAWWFRLGRGGHTGKESAGAPPVSAAVMRAPATENTAGQQEGNNP